MSANSGIGLPHSRITSDYDGTVQAGILNSLKVLTHSTWNRLCSSLLKKCEGS